MSKSSVRYWFRSDCLWQSVFPNSYKAGSELLLYTVRIQQNGRHRALPQNKHVLHCLHEKLPICIPAMNTLLVIWKISGTFWVKSWYKGSWILKKTSSTMMLIWAEFLKKMLGKTCEMFLLWYQNTGNDRFAAGCWCRRPLSQQLLTMQFRSVIEFCGHESWKNREDNKNTTTKAWWQEQNEKIWVLQWLQEWTLNNENNTNLSSKEKNFKERWFTSGNKWSNQLLD